MTTTDKETFSSFMNKVLAGTAIAIVVALIPNAILATFLKPLLPNAAAAEFLHIVQVFQFFTPIMAGFLIGQQFKFNPMQQLAVGGAAYIGSGAWAYTEVVQKGIATGTFQLRGIGDLINMMITASLAVLAVKYFGNKFGSLTIILLPIIIGTGVGYIGWKLLPYVSYVTTLIGQGINSFTTLQPILMSILIAVAFSLIIVSPISTVAIGLAIGLNGMAAGAASMGIASTAAVLVWATLKVNKSGVPIAIALGAMKMMMPNFLKHPIMAIPMVITAAISSLTVPLFNLVGTPASSGFGLVGAVGPIASLAGGSSVFIIILAWIVVPFAVAFAAHKVAKDILKLYKEDIFVFEG
ncbi:PTS transporter subunit IIC [Streptococcus dysgalactiae]|uniref:PTS transporter subunit IIC n=1 Tax=Streptococcus dysgalactiae TaxID=1334 RepID=UPI000219DC20|nr:PTS transporter subunit IIC [Streptococcus dysgalactiae]EGR89109.1 PTS system, IIC component family protein [Streptococcus dysgalactiae subsp. equisimilis SK1250]KKC22481.1 membrane protein [Streptococcus dysgalactiae subsp. equisimilis]MBM6513043.1 PTS transporter subunit IIC [Streptococcus dysgalactiae subsp. equisimilis]MBM6534271.1 PTS transporter subunit IIC [Streptococcus dysgalactiae subsp. equisimilis]MBM6547896.1 PTS transporter subunit IIC [Streptococcus dysgalactiae subsp. equisi